MAGLMKTDSSEFPAQFLSLLPHKTVLFLFPFCLGDFFALSIESLNHVLTHKVAEGHMSAAVT